MTAELVRISVHTGVAVITLDSPANRNALSNALVADLNAALDRAEADDVRVIVLTHTAPVFCAGADLRERSSGPVDSSGMVRAMRRLQDAWQPTIASVKGPVRAGGVGLMASCDLVVVAASVDFAFTEVRLGLAPAIISVPILRRVNPARLAAPFLTGERFDAAEARDLGLVTHVGADLNEVDAIVKRLVSGILASEPDAVGETKRIMRYVPTMPVDEAYAEMQRLSESLFQSPQGLEGMQAYLEKRPPAWAAETPELSL